MTTEELLKLAGILAAKYNDPEEYNDLIQEGVLAALDHEDQSYWAVYGRMRKAMGQYKNVFVATQVSVPASNLSKKLLDKADSGKPLKDYEKATIQALYNQEEATGDRQDLVYEQQEEDFLTEDEISAVLTAADTFLSDEDSSIVKKVLVYNQSHARVARDMKLSRSTVKRKVDSAVKKLSKELGA